MKKWWRKYEKLWIFIINKKHVYIFIILDFYGHDLKIEERKTFKRRRIMAGWTGLEPATSGLTAENLKPHQSISTNINDSEESKSWNVGYSVWFLRQTVTKWLQWKGLDYPSPFLFSTSTKSDFTSNLSQLIFYRNWNKKGRAIIDEPIA